MYRYNVYARIHFRQCHGHMYTGTQLKCNIYLLETGAIGVSRRLGILKILTTLHQTTALQSNAGQLHYIHVHVHVTLHSGPHSMYTGASHERPPILQ